MIEKRSVGRPSEYDPKYVAFALSYLTMYEELGDATPTIEGLCDELKISKQCCYEWQERYPEFGDACKAILVKQGRLLQAQGLKGKFAPTITRLLLSANHGMVEKTATDLNHSGSLNLLGLLKSADAAGSAEDS